MTDLHDLTDRWEELETAIDAIPGVDPWCSGPDWVLPAHAAFGAGAVPWIVNARAAGLALLAREAPRYRQGVISGLEPLWGFALPLVGSDLVGIAQRVSDLLLVDDYWSQLIVPGFPEDGVLLRQVAVPFMQLGRVGMVAGIARREADLPRLAQGGDAAWLARRPRSLKRTLRAAERRAEAAGIQFLDAGTEVGLFERLIAIERRGWKGRAGDGITGHEMAAFYRAMIDRLQARERCRALIAVQGGVDVGFILGGLRARRYRGLQLSFAEEARDFSLGHLLQRQEVRRLIESESADVYDLGMDKEYKAPWSDRNVQTSMLIVERHWS